MRAAATIERTIAEQGVDLGERGPDPEPLANQAVRRGVVGAGEDDVAIAVELSPLPLGQLPRREREAEKRGPFELIEPLQRGALGRAVNAPAGISTTSGRFELFHDDMLVATHRPARPGQRRTLAAHLPPEKWSEPVRSAACPLMLRQPSWRRSTLRVAFS